MHLPHPHPKSYRLMTWNVHHCVGIDRRHSVERIAETIREYEPDIVTLQEVEVNHRRSARIHQPSRLADLLKMDYQYHPPRIREGAGFGNAVFSRFNLRPVRSGLLPTVSYVKLQQRGALWTSVEIEGRQIQVVNTHFGLLGPERLAQARQLCGVEWLDHPDCRSQPRILCGDFNTIPGSNTYRILEGTLHDAQVLAGNPKVRTWPSYLPVVRYDHVFVGAGIQARKLDVPKTARTRVSSDHLPVVMDFSLSGPALS
jgi:endonuclease/exonuclease/phosphatase family metal-dependent hydrolase